MSATTTAAPEAPQQARSQRRFLCGGGMGLLPLREGDDGPISSMPSSSELCTGLYCTMGTATLRRSTAVASSGFQATSEGYGCPKAHAPEDWVISRPQGDTTSTLPAVLPTHASLAAAGCLLVSHSASVRPDAFDDDDAPEERRNHQKLFLYGPRPPPRPGQRVTYIIDGMWKLPSKGIM